MTNDKLLLENLPTGKPHVSFSEVITWVDCSWRHKLRYVDHIDTYEPSPFPDFGKAVHSSCEHFLRTRDVDVSIATDAIAKSWKKYDFKNVGAWQGEAEGIMADIPVFMDETFPDWEYIDAEHQLYEQIDGQPHAFKGFIDGIIKVPHKKKHLFWLIDWKTTSWGWSRQKKSDRNLQAQLVYYKNFWSQKTGINPKDVRVAFVLLKRSAKPGKHCEFLPSSVGPVPTQRNLKIVNNMLSSVKRGKAIKNRFSCKFCEFKDTEYCP